MTRTPPHLIRRRRLSTVIAAVLLGTTAAPLAHADSLARGTAAYSRGNYVLAARELTPLALRGNPKALGLLGFLYENGFGEPQAYVAAADLYAQGAVQGNPFAQAMLGLLYDKGHGVPQDFILAYKWLNLAAAHTNGHEHDTYARFRDAVASKMSKDEVAEGQRLALHWFPIGFEPSLRAERGTWESRHHR
ncbi:MAG TPA: tetratricopeptide repeat protein [Bradyrhizobium sp.]|nr:tetratricopeptide repeat protein [Bradyrhizobium sp.]